MFDYYQHKIDELTKRVVALEAIHVAELRENHMPEPAVLHPEDLRDEPAVDMVGLAHSVCGMAPIMPKGA